MVLIIQLFQRFILAKLLGISFLFTFAIYCKIAIAIFILCKYKLLYCLLLIKSELKL
jgi:hypothetical protein